MRHAVFVVPFALDATLRFVRAAATLDGVRVGLVTQQSIGQLPEDVLRHVGAVHQVGDALDADALTAAVRELAPRLEHRVDALIGILEPLQESLAAVRERLGIPGMGVDVARNFRDKARMKSVLRHHELPCARHHLATSARDALDFAKGCGYPLVCKPPAGAGAKNTFRVESDEQLDAALRGMPPTAAKPMLLEEFIRGREFSFDSITIDGRHCFHSISTYHPTPLEVMENPWIQWCVLLPRHIDGDEFAPIRAAGPKALDALGLHTGMTHMEWFERPDGSIAISEVAARPPGAQFTSLISHAHGHDFYRAWAELMCTGHFTPPERRFAVGAAFLRGQGNGRVIDVHGLEEAKKKLDGLVVEARLPQRGQARASSYEGEGYVILRHPETEVVAAGLDTVVNTLRVELGQL